MLTNEDVKKLKETLATKEDLKSFATKKDLKSFATKKDLDTFKSELIEIFPTREEFEEIKDGLDSLREILQGLAVNVDKFIGITADLKQEYAMMNTQTDRHEKWIKQIADKVGVQLKY
ncbi:hypothetical protein KKA27_03760 [Patescibacteria group bacterium]|nr:hypothetical protein [Patescibacteria group bacterium]MBU2632935.1 hypothetical protein [Patescibacteria group bacterium]